MLRFVRLIQKRAVVEHDFLTNLPPSMLHRSRRFWKIPEGSTPGCYGPGGPKKNAGVQCITGVAVEKGERKTYFPVSFMFSNLSNSTL